MSKSGKMLPSTIPIGAPTEGGGHTQIILIKRDEKTYEVFGEDNFHLIKDEFKTDIQLKLEKFGYCLHLDNENRP